MFTLKELFEVLDGLAPLKYSAELIKQGDYDNSGILVRCTDCANKVMFALDLSVQAVEKAKRLGVDTIVTHHPAIYKPVSALDVSDTDTGAVALCLSYKINVISMHLNLDVANGGIDESLCRGLGAEKFEILDILSDGVGYGRFFKIKPTFFGDYVKRIKTELNTNKIITYGKKTAIIEKVASYCGGGSGYAERHAKNGLKTDLVVTSDMPHHVIKSLVEKGMCVMILTHYASENYGFKKFYLKTQQILDGKAELFYFDDARLK